MLKTLALGFAGALVISAANAPATVTFEKDVLPIFENRCQQCHRPSEIAPMSLLTYKDARPWAKAIKAAVLQKQMPPWTADPHYGKFSNDMSLSQSEVDTIVAWVDGGAKEGDPKDAPKPRQFYEGWMIGKPDVVFTMPTPVHVPASGVVEYTYEIIPTHFDHDVWVRAAEAKAGARKEMHHVIAFLRPPGSTWFKDEPVGQPFIPQRGARQRDAQQEAGAELLIGWAPGLQPTQLKPGQAKLVKAGTDIVLQLHYTPNGKEVDDQTQIGLIFAKEPPKERVMTMNAMNFFLKIPPGDPNYESHAEFTFQHDVKLVSLMPHMHLRGKDFEYDAVYPTGEKQVLLKVPHFDFNWQLSYTLADELVMPKGTKLECTAHHDNSANNKFNPDPTKEVRWGDQTWEEMMIGWFDVAFDKDLDPRAIRVPAARLAAQQASKSE
jgi:hypothetical protein